MKSANSNHLRTKVLNKLEEVGTPLTIDDLRKLCTTKAQRQALTRELRACIANKVLAYDPQGQTYDFVRYKEKLKQAITDTSVHDCLDELANDWRERAMTNAYKELERAEDRRRQRIQRQRRRVS